LVGFGVSNKATFDAACQYSSGAIVGSAFVKALEAEPTVDKAVARLMGDLKS
jgi:tryptophan synthase alpha chain